MITIQRYTNAHRNTWNEFVKHSKNGHFMFLRDYMEYHKERFIDHSLLFYEDTHLVALMPANEADGTLYSHQGLTFGGVVTNTQMTQPRMLSVFEALRSYGRGVSLSKLIYKAIPHMYHRTPAEEDLYALFRSDAVLYRVDTSTTIDLRLPIGMSGGKKSGAKKAVQEGVQIERSSDVDTFFRMVSSRLAERYDADATHTASEMRSLMSRFPDNLILYGAFKGEEMVAGTLLYVHANVIHTQYISSTDIGRTSRAVDYLIRHLVHDVFSKAHYFDFGISNEEQGTVLNESLIRQKEEFGGRTFVHLFYRMNFT